jgi:hypothetical protein
MAGWSERNGRADGARTNSWRTRRGLKRLVGGLTLSVVYGWMDGWMDGLGFCSGFDVWIIALYL